MTSSSGLVYVVDDDASVRNGLQRLFESVGMTVYTFGSGSEFLACEREDRTACLVLDVRMPGESGLEFQRRLAARDVGIPIVFISGHADIPMSVRAMKDGAIEFLTKPFREQDLLDAVDRGLRVDESNRGRARELSRLRLRYETLSPGEREVMQRVISGRSNREVADELALSEITVKVRRGHAMQKMGAKSLADLVHFGIVLGLR